MNFQKIKNKILFFTVFWSDLEGAAPPPHSSYIQKPRTIRVKDIALLPQDLS